jgi:hypothetical protein
MHGPFGLAVDAEALFVCDGKAGLKYFEVTDEFDIEIRDQFGDQQGYDVILNNGIAIVVGADGLSQYDYSDRETLTLLSRIHANPPPPAPDILPMYYY